MAVAKVTIKFQTWIVKGNITMFLRHFPKNFRLGRSPLRFWLLLFEFNHAYKQKTQNFFARDCPRCDLALPLKTF